MSEDSNEEFGTWSGGDPLSVDEPAPETGKKMSRRDFLKTLGAGVGGLAAADIPASKALEQFAQGVDERLAIPESVDIYLKRYLGGRYEQVSHQRLIDDVVDKGVICLGEGHANPHDMDFVWRMIQEIEENTNRPLVVAFERFEAGRDRERIDAVNNAADPQSQENALGELVKNSHNAKSWGSYPSQPKFEELVYNVAQRGIPIVGIEVELPEVGLVPARERDSGWVANLENALSDMSFDSSDRPLVVVVGGSNHMGWNDDKFARLGEQSEIFQGLGGIISIQPPLAVEQYSLAPEQREIMEMTDEFIVSRGTPGSPRIPPRISESEPAYEVPKLQAVKDYWVVMNPETVEARTQKN